MILVLVKIEGGKGSATIACMGMQPDPLFPEKVVLTGVQALSWPFQGRFIKVDQWSIDKDGIYNWMAGPVRDMFELTPDILAGKPQDVPWPPGSLPNSAVVSHPDEIRKLPSEGKPQTPAEKTPADPPPPAEESPKLEPLTVASTLPGDETPAVEAQKKGRKNRLK